VYRGNAALAIKAIGKLDKTLSSLSDVPRRVSVDVAPKLTRLLDQEYAQGRDPYGRAWAPLRPATIATGRRNPPLTGFTRQLRRDTRVTARVANRAGLIIQLGADYGYFAQVGFRVGRTVVKPRRILPQFGWPESWRQALKVSTSRILKQKARGR
jgi:hypothetical protein